MEEELDIKKRILKQDLINIANDKNFLIVKENENWETYLERILKVKKPTCLYDSFLFIFVLTDNFDLSKKEKEKALIILGFNKRS
jgi:hypothetical protein